MMLSGDNLRKSWTQLGAKRLDTGKGTESCEDPVLHADCLNGLARKNPIDNRVAVGPIASFYFGESLNKLKHELSSSCATDIPAQWTMRVPAAVMLYTREMIMELLLSTRMCMRCFATGSKNNGSVRRVQKWCLYQHFIASKSMPV